MKTDKIIERIARENRTSVAQVRADIICAIHNAYNTGTPAFKALFGEQEPSVEEFIEKVSKAI